MDYILSGSRSSKSRILAPAENVILSRLGLAPRLTKDLSAFATTIRGFALLADGSSNPPERDAISSMCAPRFSEASKCLARRARASSKSSGCRIASEERDEKPGRGDVIKPYVATERGAGSPVKIM